MRTGWIEISMPFSGHKIEEASKAAARKPAMYSEGDALSLVP